MFQGSKTKTEVGTRFERMAEAHLVGLGYRLIGRNFRIKGGELDLIFEHWSHHSGVLVFVEVRMRDPRSFQTPEESLIGKKRKRILNTAKVYLANYNGRAQQIRFDLVAIRGMSLVHYPDFFGEE